VADQVTSATGKTPEEIEREMFQTRESLTEKVEALEHEVAGTVHAVKSFVTAAPDVVSDTVKQATAAVSESVKETFDITAHVRRHPLAAVGASAMLGCIVSWLVFRDSGFGTSRMASRMAEASVERPPAPPAARAEPSQPGVLDEVFAMLGDRAKELARTALESVSAAVKDSIQTQVPRLVNDASARLTENAAEFVDSSFAERFDSRRGSV